MSTAVLEEMSGRHEASGDPPRATRARRSSPAPGRGGLFYAARHELRRALPASLLAGLMKEGVENLGHYSSDPALTFDAHGADQKDFCPSAK